MSRSAWRPRRTGCRRKCCLQVCGERSRHTSASAPEGWPRAVSPEVLPAVVGRGPDTLPRHQLQAVLGQGCLTARASASETGRRQPAQLGGRLRPAGRPPRVVAIRCIAAGGIHYIRRKHPTHSPVTIVSNSRGLRIICIAALSMYLQGGRGGRGGRRGGRNIEHAGAASSGGGSTASAARPRHRGHGGSTTEATATAQQRLQRQQQGSTSRATAPAADPAAHMWLSSTSGYSPARRITTSFHSWLTCGGKERKKEYALGRGLRKLAGLGGPQRGPCPTSYHPTCGGQQRAGQHGKSENSRCRGKKTQVLEAQRVWGTTECFAAAAAGPACAAPYGMHANVWHHHGSATAAHARAAA